MTAQSVGFNARTESFSETGLEGPFISISPLLLQFCAPTACILLSFGNRDKRGESPVIQLEFESVL